MELRVLQYFLAIAREESISGAAEYLHLSQPTLSRQIRDLEEELGKQLLIRGNRKITLTEEGMLLRKRAEEIIELVHKTENEITLSDQSISGDIYIGTGESEGVRLLASIGKKMQSIYPDIHLHIVSGDSLDLTEQLNKGLFDFAILFEPADITPYDSIRLPHKDTVGVLMPSESPLAKKEFVTMYDLRDLPLIVSRQQQNRDLLKPLLQSTDSKLNIAATYNLIYNASLMVEEGMGYAIGFDQIINTHGKDGLTFRPLSPPVEITMFLVWKKYQIFSKASQIFLKLVREELLRQDR